MPHLWGATSAEQELHPINEACGRGAFSLWSCMVLRSLIPNRTLNLESMRENYAGKFRDGFSGWLTAETKIIGGRRLIDMPCAVGLENIGSRYS